MSDWRRCVEVRELIPEMAMGVAPGDERAVALAHLATCADCRRSLEETAATVDELLLLAPEHEPPPGFDAKVIDAVTVERPRRWSASKLVLAAAAVVLAAAGATAVTRWTGADDRQLATQYRETLHEADGSYFNAAALTGTEGETAGHVFAYQGNPSWVFVTIENAESGMHRVRYVTEDGRTHPLGWCMVRDGRGSWGTAIDVPVYAVDSVEVVHHGSTMSADFE
jgi:uncharacterized membrane protein